MHRRSFARYVVADLEAQKPVKLCRTLHAPDMSHCHDRIDRSTICNDGGLYCCLAHCPQPADSAQVLHTPPLRRPAAVVRDRRHVADHTHLDSRRGEGANCRFASRTGTADAHIDRAQTMVAGLVGSIHRCLLRGKRCSFSGTTEAERTRTLPRDHLALVIRDGHNGVVEGSLNVRQSKWHVLALFLLELLLFALLFGRRSGSCWFRHIRSLHSLSSCWLPYPCAALCGCERWCGSAARGRASCGGGGIRDTSRSQSAA